MNNELKKEFEELLMFLNDDGYNDSNIVIVKLNELMNSVCDKENKPIPYQTCPICAGSGVIISFNPDLTNFNSSETCPTCSGARIIPMYVQK